MQSRIDALGMRDRIVLGGHRADVFGLFKRASLVLAVSRYEGSPNVVLEAMAAGCPLVVSDIPAYTALLDGDSGAIAERDNVGSTALAIRSVLEAPQEAAVRAQHARHRVAGFTAERVAETLDKIYAAL